MILFVKILPFALTLLLSGFTDILSGRPDFKNRQDINYFLPDFQVRMLEGKSVKISPGTLFELPVRTVKQISVSAFALTLDLSSDLIEVQDVLIRGSDIPVSFDVKGNHLNLVWQSSSPLNIKEGDVFFILKLRSSSAFTGPGSFRIGIEENSLNTILTDDYKTVKEAVLKSDIITSYTEISRVEYSDELLLKLYPNPVSGPATINYTLPTDGMVTIIIHNSIGTVISTILSEERTSGTYSVNFDAGTLPYGIYFVKIKLHGNHSDKVHILRFVVNR